MSKIPYRPFPHRPANHPVPQEPGTPTDRRPTFNQQGGFRGYRSIPGAGVSERDTGTSMRLDSNTGEMVDGPNVRLDQQTGIRSNPGSGFSNDADWANFFKGNSPLGVAMGYNANSQSIADAADKRYGPQSIPSTGSIPGLPPGSAEDIRRNAQPIGGAGYPTPTVNPPDPEMGDNIPGLDAASSTPSATGYLSNVIDSTQNWMKQNFGDMYG